MNTKTKSIPEKGVVIKNIPVELEMVKLGHATYLYAAVLGYSNSAGDASSGGWLWLGGILGRGYMG